MIFLITLILQVFVMSAFCHGVSILFWENHLLEDIGEWWTTTENRITDWENFKLGETQKVQCGFLNSESPAPESPAPESPGKYDNYLLHVLKPVIGCVICMASFWGAICFLGLKVILHAPLDMLIIPELVICCVATAFVNYKLSIN